VTDVGRDSLEQRVLMLAPTEKDAALARSVLGRARVVVCCCRDLDTVCNELETGASAVLLPEEAVQGDTSRLTGWLADQPPWSDLPVLVMACPGADSAAVAQAMDLLGNVTVLERPMRVAALVSAVRSALRARQRQYQTREYLAERERAARAQALLAAIVASSDDAIVSKTLDGHILSWNGGAERLFGYTASEAVGQPITLLIPPERLEEETHILERLRRGERIEHFETVRVTKSGRRVDISLTVSPLRSGDGTILGASKVARDITQSKQVQRELKRGADRLRLLWDAAAVLLTAEDPETMLRRLFDRIGQHLGVDGYFNYMVDDTGEALRLASYSGIAEEEAGTIKRLEFGQALCGSVALERRPMVATNIQQSTEPGVQRMKDFGFRAYACNPLVGGAQLLGTLSFVSRSRERFEVDELEVFQIICRYVAAAYERLRLITRLREADRRKDEFLAVLAHELRNPLAPIRNSLHILRLTSQHDPAAERVAEMMERQVNHMVRLVDDLLEVSRITRGKIELRKERVEVAAVVRSAVETSRPLIEAGRHQLALSMPPEPLTVEGDPVRLAQILANLLNNAAKYTEAGGQIWLTVRQEGERVAIAVRDTGMGIAPHHLPRVFDLFTQLDRHAGHAQGGLGIGLTLVKSLVEMHGGSIRAHSAGPGQGSEFTVRLPLATSRYTTELAEPEFRPPPVLPARRILVVDDNRDAAQSLGMLLKLLGAEVRVVYNGAEALDTLAVYKPDFVLLDIGMPEMDGHEVARRIREQPDFQHVTLIALTGWGQDEDRRRSQTAGFDYHLIKPPDITALQSLLTATPASP
jgi:PAS domain S-box-containing protein